MCFLRVFSPFRINTVMFYWELEASTGLPVWFADVPGECHVKYERERKTESGKDRKRKKRKR